MPTDHADTLIKYCTSETAEKILSSQTLRWSAPHLFSDPFELNYESKLNFDPHILLQASIKMSIAMIFAKEVPRGQTPLATAIRRWREEERFASPEEAEEVLGELLSHIVDQRQLSIDQVMSDWRKFSRTLRICSFVAKPDNLMAWQQHADSHRGIAIRFQCDEYTTLRHPKPVHYKKVCPEITTLKDQLNIIMNNERIVAQEHFFEKFTTKSALFSPLQEWRCFHQKEEDLSSEGVADKVWYDDMTFELSEISAVYLGIYTDDTIKRNIYDLVKSKYSQAKIFQVKFVNGKYEIEFEPVTSNV